MQQFYRLLLKKAFLITKRHRFLWFFGLFAAIMGNGGEVQMLFRANDAVANLPQTLNDWTAFFSIYSPQDLLANIWVLITLRPIATLLMLLLIIVLFVFVIWLIMVSQGALVYSTAQLYTSKYVSFASAMAEARPLAGKIFLLNFATRFVLYGALVILALPFTVLAVLNNGAGFGLFGIILLAYVVTVPLAMIVNFILKYALVHIVVEKMSFWPAFVKAWKIFKEFWFVSLEMAVIMFFINIAAGISLFVLAFVLTVPFFAIAVVMSSSGVAVLGGIAILIAIVIFMLLILLIGSWLATFQHASWTLLWFEIMKGKAYPKLMRLTSKKLR